MSMVRNTLSMLLMVVGLLISLCAGTSAAWASPGPDNGSNLGLRFIGTPTPLIDADAIFLNSDGSTYTPCAGLVQGCNFDFTYQINGATDQTSANSGYGVYDTWPVITASNVDDEFCWAGTHTANLGPLTNFNCFNQNGFGQSFRPTDSGPLTGFTMAISCLSPTGSTSVTAYLYEILDPSTAYQLSGNPIATATFTLSTCSSSWSGHTFSSADFSYPAMDFGSPILSNSQHYAVLFTGDAIAGVTPLGAVDNTTPPQETTTPALAETGQHVDLGFALMGILLITAGVVGQFLRLRTKH